MPKTPLLLSAVRLAPNVARGDAVVYFFRLRSGVIYVGCSTDLNQRLHDHWTGAACRTTRLEVPLHLLRIETFSTFREARHRETQLKRWSRARKEALIRNDLHALVELSRSRE